MSDGIFVTTRAAVRSLDVFHRAIVENMEERGLIRIVDEKQDKKRQVVQE